MEPASEEIYNQWGVTLRRAPACYMHQIAKTGSLNILDYRARGICFEWIADVYKVVDNQEWSIVVSPPKPMEGDEHYIPPIKTYSAELVGIEIEGTELRLIDSFNDKFIVYTFNSNSVESFVQFLMRANHIRGGGRRKYYTFVPFSDRDKLQRSFAELNIEEIRHSKSRNVGWSDSALEIFSKVPGLLRKGDESGSPSPPAYDMPAVVLCTEEANKREEMMRSLSEIEPTSSLPPRTEPTRIAPLTAEQLRTFQSADGRYHNVDELKQIIFRGGVDHRLRPVVWKLLLDYDLWTEDNIGRENRRMLRTEDYFRMKRQWLSFSAHQEEHFSDYRDRKCQIEKDVKRTDRNLEYFEGEGNPNLIKLQNILMTYIMYNFDLGYVQGMSDLLAPILQLMEVEEDSFWCFVGFMDRMYTNFDIDQAGMKRQLQDLNQLLQFSNPRLHRFLMEIQSDNMYFCFRWLLVWFKREFSVEDILLLWEVLWTGLPCKNFHLFIAAAILDEEQDTFIENSFEFTEILKHVNELSNVIDLDKMLKKAEAIYLQVAASPKLTNEIRQIVGLPLQLAAANGIGLDSDDDDDVIHDDDGREAIENNYESSITTNFL